MGMAVSVFRPHPPYFGKMRTFWSFTNQISIICWYLLWFQIYKKPVGVCNPGNLVILDLIHPTGVLVMELLPIETVSKDHLTPNFLRFSRLYLISVSSKIKHPKQKKLQNVFLFLYNNYQHFRNSLKISFRHALKNFLYLVLADSVLGRISCVN